MQNMDKLCIVNEKERHLLLLDDRIEVCKSSFETFIYTNLFTGADIHVDSLQYQRKTVTVPEIIASYTDFSVFRPGLRRHNICVKGRLIKNQHLKRFKSVNLTSQCKMMHGFFFMMLIRKTCHKTFTIKLFDFVCM